MQIVSVRQASPAQMQQVAKKIKLGDSVNQVAGLYQAIFCSNPSPMQIQILTKGLKAVGVNYIKVTEKCEPATSADRTPELKQALSAMAQRAQMYSSLCPDPLGIGAIMVAGNQLYVSTHLTAPKQIGAPDSSSVASYSRSFRFRRLEARCIRRRFGKDVRPTRRQ
jgi:hypothetical protein